MMDNQALIERWQEELNSAALYDALAAHEDNEKLRVIYRKLAEVERGHADTWTTFLRDRGVSIPPFGRSARTRILIWLARTFGPTIILPTVVGLEQMQGHEYSLAPEATQAMAVDEHSHARLLTRVAEIAGGLPGSAVARLEGRHRAAGGNALRAAVLGANDGLVSNLSLVMGVAGANLPGAAILVSGVAGLLAGAFSMALGEWLSVQSSRELYQHQIDVEREELAAAPAEEQEELALIYQAKGVEETQARSMAAQIMGDRGAALDTLVREELGVEPKELGGSAWEAALTSFVLFAVGAVIPVIPYLFLVGPKAVTVSLLLSAVGLFAIGAGITLFTGRPVVVSGARQVLFGLAAAAATYAIGRLIGVRLAG